MNWDDILSGARYDPLTSETSFPDVTMEGLRATMEQLGQAGRWPGEEGKRISAEEVRRCEARRVFVICEAAKARGWTARLERRPAQTGFAHWDAMWRVTWRLGNRYVSGPEHSQAQYALELACDVLVLEGDFL